MGKVKNYKLENMLGVLPLLKVFTKETGAGLFLPQLSDENKEKDDYKYSIVVTKETKDQIQEKYSKVLNPNEMLSDKGIKSLISNSHGTYTYESAAIAESIGKKLEEYKVASPDRKEELEKEIKDLGYININLFTDALLLIPPKVRIINILLKLLEKLTTEYNLIVKIIQIEKIDYISKIFLEEIERREFITIKE